MSGKTYRWPSVRRPEVEAALRKAGSLQGAAALLGVSMPSFRYGCQAYGISPTEILAGVRAPMLPEEERSELRGIISALKAELAEIESAKLDDRAVRSALVARRPQEEVPPRPRSADALRV
jgi:hypothetical protein